MIAGLVLILLCSFSSAHTSAQKAKNSLPGWLLPSATGAERFAAWQDAGDPNGDLHLSVRKQTKVKCVKKLTLNAMYADRSESRSAAVLHPIAGFDTVKRPAYYIFLFRYTLF
ncbi:hypothetical protein HHL16_21690 [Pseudoflavitalea sp. G-6-1-2]|uniref:hypothetical protein n=1 Tax=Pseudoflavitalea sp. G-6-1-2 TaxID=2728841 RepID=UPI00146C09F3|nr:hypothetical protein [Pseudoflavitalea sp. G-6-1-2]NML23508.1 hypothetical protein [Pseudoflavitalea sp. G-6-1-2]